MQYIIADNIFILLLMIMVVKSIIIGSDFNPLLWIKHRSKYMQWFNNQHSYSYFLNRRKITLTAAPKRFMTVRSEVYEYLEINHDKSKRTIRINELPIEIGSAIVFIEKTGNYKDKSIQLGKYLTYVVHEINIAPAYISTTIDGYDEMGMDRIATILPVLE